MHMAFLRAKAGCDKWHDYEMTVAPYERTSRSIMNLPPVPQRNLLSETALQRSCPPCAMWILQRWSCFTQGWCGRPPVRMAVSATTPSAAIKTRMQRNIPNIGTRQDSGGTRNAFTGDSGRSWAGGFAGSCLCCGHLQRAAWDGASLQPGGAAAVREAGTYNTREKSSAILYFSKPSASPAISAMCWSVYG